VKFLSVEGAGKLTAVSDAGKQVREPKKGRRRGRSAGRFVAGAVLALAAVAVTRPLPWPEALYTVVLIGVLPAVLLAADGPAEVPPGATRHGLYLTTWLGLWALAALAAAASLQAPSVPSRLALSLPPARLLVGWAVALTAAGAAVVGVWRALGHAEPEIGRFLIPRTAGERLHYVWVSATAGITEEIVFRGFLVRAVEVAAGSVWAGVAVSSAVFGVAHRYQGAWGAARASVLGAILCAPLLVLDSIIPAILAHAALDLLSGLWWRERLWRETIVPPRSSI
jgi:membrane protease YdiL (CAAX protease family)